MNKFISGDINMDQVRDKSCLKGSVTISFDQAVGLLKDAIKSSQMTPEELRALYKGICKQYHVRKIDLEGLYQRPTGLEIRSCGGNRWAEAEAGIQSALADLMKG